MARRLEFREPRCFWRGRDVGLTLAEYRLVRTLFNRRGTDIPYAELYAIARPDLRGLHVGLEDDGYKVNMRSFVKRIRNKFLRVDPRFSEIENFPGYGYRWRASR